MDAVLRALVMYFFLLLVFKINGNRSIAQITMFDFIMLLIIGEATQQALIGDDFSFANSLIVITTLIVADIIMSFLKGKSKKIEMILEGIPLILLEEGEVFKDRLEKSRVDEADILEAARELHGLQRLDQIRFAILERDGKISIIPKS